MNENKCSYWGGQTLNKAFTLIELLAVIVIIAIIALIATPIVLNIIKDTKKEADQRSVKMYAKAIENAITQYQLEKNKPLTGTFETLDGKEILQNGELIFKVEYDGPKISIKRIDIYEDGSIYLEDIENDKKDFPKTYGKKQWYQNGDIVYFDVAKGKGCTQKEYESSWDESARDYLNSKTGYNGYINKDSSNNEIAKAEKQNSCLKFYAFLDDGSEKVNLILDHNTTSKIAWGNSGVTSNGHGPIDVINQLRMDTDNWNETVTPSNYEYKSDIAKSYIIDYSHYKARLITAQEIAQITEYKNWNESINTSDFSFTCWLSLISKDSYWTASIYPYKIDLYAWVVSSNRLSGGWTAMGYIQGASNGVRPVIEVLKSNL